MHAIWAKVPRTSSGSVVARCTRRRALFGDVVLGRIVWQVIHSVLKGMHPSHQRNVILVDLLPYDGCLPLAAIEGINEDDGGVPGVGGVLGAQKKKEVTNEALGCISAVWAFQPPEKLVLKTFIEGRIRGAIMQSLRSGGSKLRGADLVPPVKAMETVTESAVLDESKFKYTKPLSDGTLPIRQTVLSAFDEADPGIQSKLDQLVQVHNTEHNPSGRPFKDNKRGADDTDDIKAEAEAVSLAGQADVPQTKALLLEKFPGAPVLAGQAEFEYIVVRDGGIEKYSIKRILHPNLAP